MMSHDEARGLLADFGDKEIQKELRAEIQAHVDACSECREWLLWYREVKDVMGAQPAHLSSLDLALRAAGSEELSDQDITRIDDHLEHCEACRDLHSRSRSALKESRNLMTFRRVLKRARWALPLAAGLLLGILGGREVWKTESGAGVLAFRVLSTTTRAMKELPEVALSGGGDQVFVAVDLPLIENLDSGELVRIVLRDKLHQPIWESTLRTGELRQRSNDGRTLLLGIPAKGLHSGRYLIRVSLPGKSTSVEFPFLLVDD